VNSGITQAQLKNGKQPQCIFCWPCLKFHRQTDLEPFHPSLLLNVAMIKYTTRGTWQATMQRLFTLNAAIQENNREHH